MFVKADVHIRGITPHVQHNGQMADRSCKYVVAIKLITGKPAKQKTDADFRALDDLEWEGALYLDANRRPVVPGAVIEGAYFEAGKKQRLGSTIRNALQSSGDWPLIYKGQKDVDALKGDPNFRYRCIVRNPSTKARIARMRPIFREWELKYTVQFREDLIDRNSIEHLTTLLGTDIGLSDDRTKMGGRFEVVSFK